MTRRVVAIRKKMEESGLQALIVFSQVVLGEKAAVRYVSDYRLLTRKAYIVLPLAGEAMLVLPTLGQKMAASQASWIKDIRCSSETSGIIREVAEKLKSGGCEKATIGITGLSDSLPHRDFTLLKEELPDATFVDGNSILSRVRMIKSPEEIELIRATTEIADDSYRLLLDVLRHGINEREIMAEIHKLLTLRGVEETLILTAKGRSFPCFISPPGSYSFHGGDHYVFSIEIAGPDGYWSQIVRPLCLGRPSAGYDRLFEAGRKALEKGLSNLLPGKRVNDVVSAIAEEAHMNGFKTGLWSGHAMGLDLGDGVGLFEDNTLELKEGMVFTLHPHIMSMDGKEGLLIGDTYVVKKEGPENLSQTLCELKCVE